MPGRMTDAVHVRPARPGDHAAVLGLAGRLTEGVAPWRDPAGVATAVRGWVEQALATTGADDRAILVAERDGRVVGFVTVAEQQHWSGGQDAYVGELAVEHDQERAGVGRALVDAARGWAVGRGLTRLTLSTGAANARARAFYAALGFDEEDVRLTLRW